MGPTVPVVPNVDRLATVTQSGTPTGTQPGSGTLRTEENDVPAHEDQELSVLRETFVATPMVVPVRAHLDSDC